MSATRRPLKSLGQNFLVDGNIIDRIIQAADIRPDQPVLEIGPGRGALTGHLAERAERLVLIEFDHALAAWHQDQLKDNQRVTVIKIGMWSPTFPITFLPRCCSVCTEFTAGWPA